MQSEIGYNVVVMSAAGIDYQSELRRLCVKFEVETLEVFGSFATGIGFDNESDLDFLVTFRSGTNLRPSERYFGLKTALEMLFGRTVDLVMLKAVKNPYFLKEIAPTRKLMYG